MYLKVMHDGASEIHALGDSDATYSIYADVTSCHFKRYPVDPAKGQPMAEAHLFLREPVKTAEVPGFAEVEKHIVLDGDAFLMNEQGRTISKFKLRGINSGGGRTPEPTDEQLTLEMLSRLPYEAAAAIRTTAKQAGSVSAAYLIKMLDKAKVAMDA